MNNIEVLHLHICHVQKFPSVSQLVLVVGEYSCRPVCRDMSLTIFCASVIVAVCMCVTTNYPHQHQLSLLLPPCSPLLSSPPPPHSWLHCSPVCCRNATCRLCGGCISILRPHLSVSGEHLRLSLHQEMRTLLEMTLLLWQMFSRVSFVTVVLLGNIANTFIHC